MKKGQKFFDLVAQNPDMQEIMITVFESKENALKKIPDLLTILASYDPAQGEFTREISLKNEVFTAEEVGFVLWVLNQECRPAFAPMLNAPATNMLTAITAKAYPPKKQLFDEEATIEKGDMKIFINNFDNLSGTLKTSTHKALDLFTMYLTEQNHYRGTKIENKVCIPLEEYMSICGIPDTKASKDHTRKQLVKDLELLSNIWLEWTEHRGKKKTDFIKKRLCIGYGIKKGIIQLEFHPDFAQYLINSYIMQFPIELFKLDNRNPNAYYLGKKIMLHNSNDNNRTKGTSNIIKVKNLLEVCPTIPTYEEVKKKCRHVDRLIKNPFENALNTLTFIKWEYSNTGSIPLTDEQLISIDYETFKELYIKFFVIGAPDQTDRLKRKAERIETAKKHKNKNGTTKK